MRIRTLEYRRSVLAFVIVSAVVSLNITGAAQICSSGVCATTWQQDTGVPDISVGGVYRTGENLMESGITASTFANNGFGKICSTDANGNATLDGQVYAQPLAAEPRVPARSE